MNVRWYVANLLACLAGELVVYVAYNSHQLLWFKIIYSIFDTSLNQYNATRGGGGWERVFIKSKDFHTHTYIQTLAQKLE